MVPLKVETSPAKIESQGKNAKRLRNFARRTQTFSGTVQKHAKNGTCARDHRIMPFDKFLLKLFSIVL